MGRLYRGSDKLVAGVCSGIAEGFGFKARNIRLLFVVLCLCSALLPLLVAYVILAVLLPEKGREKSYAERMNEKLGNK